MKYEECKITGLELKEIGGMYIIKGSYKNRFGLKRYFAQNLVRVLHEGTMLVETLRRLADLLERDMEQSENKKLLEEE